MVKEKQNLNPDRGADPIPIHHRSTNLPRLCLNPHRRELHHGHSLDLIQSHVRVQDPVHEIKTGTLLFLCTQLWNTRMPGHESFLC